MTHNIYATLHQSFVQSQQEKSKKGKREGLEMTVGRVGTGSVFQFCSAARSSTIVVINSPEKGVEGGLSGTETTLFYIQ